MGQTEWTTFLTQGATFHPRHGKSIADRHRRTGGGSKVQWADQRVHRNVQHPITTSGQAGDPTSHQCDARGAVSLEMGEDRE